MIIYSGTIKEVQPGLYEGSVYNTENNLVYQIVGDAIDSKDFELIYTTFICEQLNINGIDWK